MKLLVLSCLISALNLVPQPKEMEQQRGVWEVEPGTALVVPDDASEAEIAEAQELVEVSGLPLVVARASQQESRQALYIGERHRQPKLGGMILKRRVKDVDGIPPGGYLLTIWGKGAAVVGADALGTYHGLQTLLQIAQQSGGVLPQIKIRDWPRKAVRGAYLSHVPSQEELTALSRHKFNLLFLQGEALYRPESPEVVPWARAAATARARRLQVVPVLSILDHALPLLYDAPHAAEGERASQQALLRGVETVILQNSNILDNEESPVQVEVSGVPCVRDRDYSLSAGQLQAPFGTINAPWTLRRIPGGSIPAGATANITYNFVPQNTAALCPQAAKSKELLNQLTPALAAQLSADGLHLGGESINALNRCLRCAKAGTTDAGALLAAVNLQLPAWTAASDRAAYFGVDALAPGKPAAGSDLGSAAAQLPRELVLTMTLEETPEAGRSAWEWLRGLNRPFLPVFPQPEQDTATHWAYSAVAETGHAQGVVLRDPQVGSARLAAAVNAGW